MNSLSFEPAIDLIIGSMYSGKTTELIRRLMIYHEMEMKVVYINSKKDDRSPHSFSTHNGTIGQIPYDSVQVTELKEAKVDHYQVIGIDEAQLFGDLKEQVLDWVEKHDKIVLVCGLNGDFQRKPFGQVIDLVSYCDSVTKLTPFCTSCKKKRGEIRSAHFTKRTIESQETVFIGGRDAYIPTCRKCFLGLS